MLTFSQRLHPTGFERAGQETLKLLDTLIVDKVTDIKDVAKVETALKSCVASKQYGLEDILTPLITKACISVLPANRNMFSVENVRVAKVLGGSVSDCSVVAGTVLTRNVEGTVKKAVNAKVVSTPATWKRRRRRQRALCC